MSFPSALALVRLLEGGKVNNPADPGGPTNCGLTQGTFALLGFKGSVLDATPEQIANAYRMIWDELPIKSPGNSMPLFYVIPEPADSIGFQFYINVKPGEFIRAFQGALGAKMDGDMGPATWKALSGWNGRGMDLSENLLTAQHWFYVSGDSPFKKGLLDRIEKVRGWLAKQ